MACYVSVERCQDFPDAADALPMICDAIISFAKNFFPATLVPPFPTVSPGSMVDKILGDWAALVAPKPLVVLFDEVDVLQDQALVSFLRQLRGGFAMRGIGTFPVSVALVGMRDLRDYLVRSKDGVSLNPGSPFNIKQDSATLSSFSAEDVRTLVAQHTSETGQTFTDEALALVYELTRGQPWLVNALLQKCVWQLCPKGESVGIEQVEAARELLIQERAVHLDSLAERLRDPRVKRIVQSIMVGESDPTWPRGDDFADARLGTCVTKTEAPVVANPIYRETIARILSTGISWQYPLRSSAGKGPTGAWTWRPYSMNFRISGPNTRISGKRRLITLRPFHTCC